MSDPIVKPAVDAVEWFGVTVPVFEHMLVGEIDELQRILVNDSTGFRKDVECFVAIARYRTDTKLKIESVLRQPVDQVAFTRDLRRLLAPFTRAQKALVLEARIAAADMMNGSELADEIERTETLLHALRSLSAAGESLPS
jgi:hypothetical protein